MTHVAKTSDYTRFKTIVGNRPTNPAHINRLMRSIEENPHLIEANPILINNKWEIIDGQHRFEALKRLAQPVFYYQLDDYTLKDVLTLNTSSKNWSLIDYANSFALQGKKAYIIYLKYIEMYGLGKTITAQLLMLDKTYTTEGFKTGKLQITDLKKTDRLIADFMEISDFFSEFYNTKSFTLAYLRVWLNPKYKHADFMAKLPKYHTKMQARNKVMDYIRDFEEIYNTQVSELESVRFD